MKKFILTTILALLAIAAGARVKLPPVLGSNMVLQQDSDVKIWGRANPGAKIQITTSWDGKRHKTEASDSGEWAVTVHTPLAGGPWSIVCSDGEEVVLDNVLTGEVWFCSGQSNMEMPMQGFPGSPVEGFSEAMASATSDVPVRMFLADVKDGKLTKIVSRTPLDECEVEWHLNNPGDVAVTSAVAYYFASILQSKMNVPVGIIVASHGGTRIETWMDRQALEGFAHVDKTAFEAQGPVTDPYTTPSVLYNSKLHPFFPYVIKGMIWYQGENNCANPEDYSKLLPAFVKMLREEWQAKLPFYYVQVTPFHSYWGTANSGARLREHQWLGGKDIQDCSMVCTADLGDYHYIHFPKKRQVAERLVNLALAKTYGREGLWCESPSFKDMEIREGKAYIGVDNAPLGLCPMFIPLVDFEIAGEDRVFHPADAMIYESDPRHIVVSSPEVPAPVAVRYGYSDYLSGQVKNNAGLPLIPFRTDNWD